MQATINVLASDVDASCNISFAPATDLASGTGCDADQTTMLCFSFNSLISSSVACASLIITIPSIAGTGISA